MKKKFAKNLRFLREEKNLTQLQLALKLGFNVRNVITNWESGKILPDAYNLALLAQFFGVTIDYLIGIEK